MYEGVIVPMVTPFEINGKINRDDATRMTRYLLSHRVIPFILGTSGEVYSISLNERDVLIKVLIENRKEGVPLITGMGGLTFDDTVREANKYFDWGIDAVVLTLPGYFELKEDQVYQYFRELSDKLNGNIILYNIPATIHNSISVTVADRLSKVENIIGIKDSEFDETRMNLSLSKWKQREDFFYLVGVNEIMYKALRLGADGLVPSTANLAPGLYTSMMNSAKNNQFGEVDRIQLQTDEILSIYKNGQLLGESIATLKFLVSLSGMMSPYMLSPLTELSEEEKREALRKWEHIDKYWK